MKRMLGHAIFLSLLATTPLCAQRMTATLPAAAKAILPAQGKLIDAASADLDGDGVLDYVAVTEAEPQSSAPEEDPTRIVFVIRQKPAGTFQVAAKNPHALIAKSLGGGMGDPFDSLSAGTKKFTLSHFGGRREKWTANYTFSYSSIDQAWQLTEIKASRWHNDARLQTFRPPHDFGKIAFQDFDAEKWQGRGAGYRQSKRSQPLISE